MKSHGGSFVPRSVEPVFPIRMLALDLDGTLVGDDLVLGDRTCAAITTARRAGVHVSIVTGRMATSALRFADALELVGPIVACQGAIVRAMPTPGASRVGRLLYHEPLVAAVARETIEWSRAHGLDPHVNHLERIVIRADDPEVEDYSAFLGGRAVLVPDLSAAIVRPVTKVIAVGDATGPADLLERAREHFRDRASVTVSHPRFLEFLSPGVSKGRAVRWLARRQGVPLEQVLAIGDQMNDLEMVAAVGHGVAMSTSPAPVLAAARYIAPAVGDEGAAQVIESLVLAGGDGAPRNAGRFRAALGAA
jgi:Cof subfamily protein (haloacid dehalogenase superfamily)